MRSLWCLVVVLVSTTAFCQQMIELGPFGRPIAVQGEGQDPDWQIPIIVYSDADVEVYVPDITSLGWAAWHIGPFRNFGTYFVPLNIFFKTDRACLSNLTPEKRRNPEFLDMCKRLRYQIDQIVVDTRKNTVKTAIVIAMEEDARLHPEYMSYPNTTKPISELAMPLRKAIASITEIIERRSDRYRELSDEGAGQKNEISVAKLNERPHLTPQSEGELQNRSQDSEFSPGDIYRNARFGFSVQYPHSFIPQPPPENGDGLEFKSKDGKASLVVSASFNYPGQTVASLYQDHIKDVHGTLGYSKLSATWFVISWENKTEVGYEKVYFGPDIISEWTLTYPKDQKLEYAKIVTVLGRSFHPGDISKAR